MSRYKPKPCPGCGELYPIPVNTVCNQCAQKLTDYDRMKAAFSKKGSYATSFGFRDKIPFKAYIPGLEDDAPEIERFQDNL